MLVALDGGRAGSGRADGGGEQHGTYQRLSARQTLAQWIALNRLSEVRLNVTKFGQNTDTGELDFANRNWHYDTRYFDTSIATMKRVVVRVYRGDAKTKGNPLARPTGFLGSSVAMPGSDC